jgi:hypothetical protein
VEDLGWFMKCLINPWLIKQRKKMNAPVTFGKADIDHSTGRAGSFG